MTAAMAPKLRLRAKTFFTLTPMERAACWSLAVARIATPVRENLKMMMNRIVVMTAKMKPQRSPEGTPANTRFGRGRRNLRKGPVSGVPYHIHETSEDCPQSDGDHNHRDDGLPDRRSRMERLDHNPGRVPKTMVMANASQKGIWTMVRAVKQMKAPSVMLPRRRSGHWWPYQ